MKQISFQFFVGGWYRQMEEKIQCIGMGEMSRLKMGK
jgi:hypothetical protein